MPPSTRRLAAIMFSDIAGYTAMMQQDEKVALAKVKRYRQVLEEMVNTYNGRILQHYGDGSLSIFTSAVEAVNCAKGLQNSLQEDPKVLLRIGIHIGDVVLEGEYIYGDGVNLASRVESIAAPGSVLITERVISDIRSHPEFRTISLGKFQLKNVTQPIEVYALAGEGFVIPSAKDIREKSEVATRVQKPLKKSLLLLLAGMALIVVILGSAFLLSRWNGSGSASDEDPSIAVLPFRDLSPQNDQEYFSDGISEEILNALAQIDGLKVAGRTSSFSFKDKNADLREIGETLDVKTVLEGSVRKAGDRVRITAQLVNTHDGYQLWSQSYERKLDDIFAIQDEIARAVVDNLKGILMRGETRPIIKAPTQNQQAYEAYLRGKYLLSRRTEGAEKAVGFFRDAIALDSSFAAAYAGLGHAWLWLGWGNFLPSMEAFPEGKRFAEKALNLDSSSAYAYYILGSARLWYDWEWEQGRQTLEKALMLNPSEAEAYLDLGWYYIISGRFEDAMNQVNKAIALDPLHLEFMVDKADFQRMARRFDQALKTAETVRDLYPDNADTHWITGMIQYNLGNYDRSVAAFQQSVRLSGEDPWALIALSMALAKTEKRQEGRQILETLLKEDPNLVSTSPVEIAMTWLSLDETEKALDMLEQAFRIHANWLISLKVDPVWDDLRSQPRFVALLQQMNFPE